MRRLTFALFLSICLNSFAAIDLAEIERDLDGPGVRGWIHGAAHDLKTYVFTYRDPKDFFEQQNFSLLPRNANALAKLQTVKRHDEVLIKGKFAKNPSPQKHILLEDLQILVPYDPGVAMPVRHREASLPKELIGQKSFLGSVHAVGEDGQILVVEYKDAVLPIFVKDTTVSKTLYRGDKVRLHYVIQKTPQRPPHLLLDPAVSPAIEIQDFVTKVEGKPVTLDGSIVKLHDKPLELEGALVYFPQSPQIRFPVFAVQVVDSDGIKRNFTLVNFDEKIFEKIRAKLDAEWQSKAKTAVNGRNCLVNPGIALRAEGLGNVVSPGQANPQILLDGPQAIEFL